MAPASAVFAPNDKEIADMFGDKMRAGHYGRLLKVFFPILSYCFEKVKNL
ncbi:hypothetical protein [Breoghania sp.]|nr:hypothetical protein [Breoghania sp.]MDJ0933197.1 hypothetical protein [Breoghania sp.]